MPISRKRKKKGKVVRPRQRQWTDEEIAEMNSRPAGVSLQDLINVVAAQEFKKDPDGYREAHPAVDTPIDFEDPKTQAVIRAVDSQESIQEENKDGR